MPRRRPLFTALLAGLLLLSIGCRSGEEADPASEPDVTAAEAHALAAEGEAPPVVTAEMLASGRTAYEQYCMNCHGPAGKGDGPTAELLEEPVPDLTTLETKYNGMFPESTIRAMVDGRETVPAHMSREMPIWGNIWTDVDGDPEQEAVVRQRIDNLVAYIKSMQATS